MYASLSRNEAFRGIGVTGAEPEPFHRLEIPQRLRSLYLDAVQKTNAYWATPEDHAGRRQAMEQAVQTIHDSDELGKVKEVNDATRDKLTAMMVRVQPAVSSGIIAPDWPDDARDHFVSEISPQFHQITDELVMNACLHGRGKMKLAAYDGPIGVMCVVHDEGSGPDVSVWQRYATAVQRWAQTKSLIQIEEDGIVEMKETISHPEHPNTQGYARRSCRYGVVTNPYCLVTHDLSNGCDAIVLHSQSQTINGVTAGLSTGNNPFSEPGKFVECFRVSDEPESTQDDPKSNQDTPKKTGPDDVWAQFGEEGFDF